EERRFVEATRLFEQMIDAVAHIHAFKAYHRDLKPENFILGADGNLKLTDFGLATRESLSTDFECGSKPYMSYENRNGGLNPNDPTVYGPRDDYSPRLSDVWALGVLFLNLLFAQSPWTDPSRESCFKFCRFLREGAGFLVNQFPRLPREVADFLVTRIFSPESGRCNVLELKQWVQDLGFPFTLTGATTTARSTALRHKNTAGAVTTGRRTVAVPASPAAHSAKTHNIASSADKKWSPAQGSFSGSVSKMPHVPHAVLASTALALDNVAAAPSSKPRSPHNNKRFAAMQPTTNAGTTATSTAAKSGHFSTSVPAAVFSQIIPATQAAAARKMMPREFNQTAAKAAAAILQSSMLCLPKNGLGQGKIDDSADAVFAFDDEGSGNDNDEADEDVADATRAAQQEGSSSWNQLEHLSEAAEEDEDGGDDVSGAHASSSAAAATDISRTFPEQPASSSMAFSLSKDLDLFDSDEDMDFNAPISFDDAYRPPIRLSAKSLPAQKSNLVSYSATKRPLPMSAGVTPVAATASSSAAATAAAGITGGSSTVSESSFADDMMDMVGHFSDSEKGHSIGSIVHKDDGSLVTRSENRVRFKEIPQSSPVLAGRSLLSRVNHPEEEANANNATTSADSSLTATLVTPSVDEYYGPPRLKQDQVAIREPVSATTLVSNSNGSTSSAKSNKALPKLEVHDMDADDEADDNWRTRNRSRNHYHHSNNRKEGFDSTKTPSRAVDFSQFSYGKNNHALYRNQGKASLHNSTRT
ncbi:hypothetical protein J3B02_004267, partial [Coemansia erecta]